MAVAAPKACLTSRAIETPRLLFRSCRFLFYFWAKIVTHEVWVLVSGGTDWAVRFDCMFVSAFYLFGFLLFSLRDFDLFWFLVR